MPCKLITAVLDVFAQRLDAHAWLLLTRHGRDRDRLLASLHFERALQRLGPLELLSLAAVELKRGLAELYRQLQGGDTVEDEPSRISFRLINGQPMAVVHP